MEPTENIESPPEPIIAMGGAIKSLDETGRIGGYLIMWGNPSLRDLQNEYFTPDTEFRLPKSTLPLKLERPLPAFYQHALDDTVHDMEFGTIDTIKTDDIGVWIEAQINLNDRYVRAVHDRLIKRGKAGWSSGALPQSVKVAADGRIEHWRVIEGSITPTPAEPRTISYLTTLKALPMQSVKGLEEVEEREAEEPAQSADNETPIEEPKPTEQENKQPLKAKEAMNPQELIQMIIAALAESGVQVSQEQATAVMEKVSGQMQQASMNTATMTPNEIKSVLPQIAEMVKTAVTGLSMRDAVKSGITDVLRDFNNNSQPQSQAGGGHRSPAGGGHVRVVSKYDALTPEDMSYLATLRSARGKAVTLSQEFYREFADKAASEHNAGRVTLSPAGVKMVSAIKANELDYSTLASGGDEFVPNVWSDQIWERLRLENKIASSIKTVEMPSNPYELPIESTDPTVSFVPETTDEAQLTLAASNNPIPDSKLGTGKVTLTAKKLALRVGVSAELEEDSVIPFIAQLRKQAQRAIMDSIDNVFLNGDTESGATGNINSDDGAPTATNKYMAFNGIRKLALVTGTSLKVDANGTAPTLAAIRSARAKMASVYWVDPTLVRIVTDASTYAKLLGMPEFITIDKAGPQATAQRGVLGYIDGIPLFVSNEMGLTEADGKISATPGNNTLGQMAFYSTWGWVAGYRRRVVVSADFLPYYDAYQLTATVRVALTSRDNTCASVLYNILV